MKKIEFKYKGSNINIYIVAFFSILVSTALFLNIQKEFYMSFVYMGMGIVTFISVLTHVKKSKKMIHSLTFKDNLVIVNFKHTLVEPLVIDLREIYCEISSNEIFLRDKSKEVLLKVDLSDLKRLEEREELILMLNIGNK